MAQGMARLFTELGGRIKYSTEVDHIVIENNQAVGLQSEDNFIAGDIIMCNADFPYAMKNFIPENRHKGKYSDKKIDSMEYSCSCLLFYFGMNRKYPEIKDVHNFIFSEALDQNIDDIFNGEMIDDPSLYMYIASKMDASLAPEGKDGIYVLMPVSNVYVMKYEWNEEITKHYRRKVIDKIKEIPGMEHFDNEIVVETSISPLDFEEKFNAYRGATFGLMPTLTQSNHLRPQSKATHCENLYFTGSSTHPGAGVPIVLLSAKIAVQEVLKDYSGERA